MTAVMLPYAHTRAPGRRESGKFGLYRRQRNRICLFGFWASNTSAQFVYCLFGVTNLCGMIHPYRKMGAVVVVKKYNYRFKISFCHAKRKVIASFLSFLRVGSYVKGLLHTIFRRLLTNCDLPLSRTYTSTYFRNRKLL